MCQPYADSTTETDTAGGNYQDSLNATDTGVVQTPVRFVVQNHSDSVKFITIDDYYDTPGERMKKMRLEHMVAGQWEQVPTYANNICDEIAQSTHQCTYVGDFWMVAHAIAPGDSFDIVWDGFSYHKANMYCADESGEGCYEKNRPETGRYRLKVNIGDDCVPMADDGVCYPSDGDMSSASGEVTDYIEFEIPFVEEQLTLSI